MLKNDMEFFRIIYHFFKDATLLTYAAIGAGLVVAFLYFTIFFRDVSGFEDDVEKSNKIPMLDADYDYVDFEVERREDLGVGIAFSRQRNSCILSVAGLVPAHIREVIWCASCLNPQCIRPIHPLRIEDNRSRQIKTPPMPAIICEESSDRLPSRHEDQIFVRLVWDFFHIRCCALAACRPGGNAKWRPLFGKVLSMSADTWDVGKTRCWAK